jgi:hypothetical protein
MLYGSGDGIYGSTLGCHPLPEGVAKESVAWPSVVTGFRGSFHRFLVQFLVVPICTYALLAMVYPATIDLVVVVGLS